MKNDTMITTAARAKAVSPSAGAFKPMPNRPKASRTAAMSPR
jgi:hypothetical protein